MKISRSVRELYEDLRPRYELLKKHVDAVVMSKKEARWHYEGRVKADESFALKLETGRVLNLLSPDDFFACTLVVENHSRIGAAEEMILDTFKLDVRRPKDPKMTHIAPYSFEFDDLRLYVRWVDDRDQKPTGLADVLFEVQIKTFLQHAWSIATHDFVYKADDVDWSGSRIAYQVKAMLENAELSIGEAKTLASSAMLDRIDFDCSELRMMLAEVKKRWPEEALPKDLRRFAQTLAELIRTLRIELEPLWATVDEATNAGEGANTLNLSPYGAICAALIRKHGAGLFKPLEHAKARPVFIPLEIDLPALPAAQSNKIIRPPALGKVA